MRAFFFFSSSMQLKGLFFARNFEKSRFLEACLLIRSKRSLLSSTNCVDKIMYIRILQFSLGNLFSKLENSLKIQILNS